MTQLLNNFKSVVERINLASNSRTNNLIPVRLVAVSKLKSIDDIIEIYNEDKLSKLKQERIKEIEFNDLMKEIIYNSLLLFCLFSICYSVDIKTAYNYHLALGKLFNTNSNINNVIIIILNYFYN